MLGKIPFSLKLFFHFTSATPLTPTNQFTRFYGWQDFIFSCVGCFLCCLHRNPCLLKWDFPCSFFPFSINFLQPYSISSSSACLTILWIIDRFVYWFLNKCRPNTSKQAKWKHINKSPPHRWIHAHMYICIYFVSS